MTDVSPVATRRCVRTPPPLAMVIFGASGDLTARKILPALAELADRGRLNDRFTVIGVARTQWTDEEFRAGCPHGRPERRAMPGPGSSSGSATSPASTPPPRPSTALRQVLDEADTQATARRATALYYLATIPDVFALVAGALAKEGCNQPGAGWRLRPAGGREALRPRPRRAPWTSTRSCTLPSTRARSSGSTTTWARRRSRTSSRCASPTPSSSRSGTAATSSRCRSPSPRASASSTGAASTRRPGRCATSCRTT